MRRTLPPRSQQKRTEVMPSTKLVSFGHFASSNQVSQRFVRCVWHPHGGQISRAMTASRLCGVAPSLNGINRVHRNPTGHITLHAECTHLPIQHVLSGPGFVASGKMFDRSKSANEPSDRLLAVGKNAEGLEFSSGLKRIARTCPPKGARQQSFAKKNEYREVANCSADTPALERKAARCQEDGAT